MYESVVRLTHHGQCDAFKCLAVQECITEVHRCSINISIIE
jgi:hypothetical protein